MTAIHIIKNDDGLPQIRPVQPGSQLFESGYWVVSEATAEKLIGKKIFFHEQRSGPSFFGGTIQHFQLIKNGERAGRVVFTFLADPACKGVMTPREGWSQEMKIVY